MLPTGETLQLRLHDPRPWIKEWEKLPVVMRLFALTMAFFVTDPTELSVFDRWVENGGKLDETIKWGPQSIVTHDLSGPDMFVDMLGMIKGLMQRGFSFEQIREHLSRIRVGIALDHAQESQDGDPNADIAAMYGRNMPRLELLRWIADFLGGNLWPSVMGICHQIVQEYWGEIVAVFRDGKRLNIAKDDPYGGLKDGDLVTPESMLVLDSHASNGGGFFQFILGGGGPRALRCWFGRFIKMGMPKVTGLRLIGQLQPGVDAKSLVGALTDFVGNDRTLKGSAVEFFGPGLDTLSTADRCTLSNQGPEYGALMVIVRFGKEVLNHLSRTGRSPVLVALVEQYCDFLGLSEIDDEQVVYTYVREFDLASVVAQAATNNQPKFVTPITGLLEAIRGFCLGKWGEVYEAAQLIICIAAITSCTSTGNPRMMVEAALVARAAAELGLRVTYVLILLRGLFNRLTVGVCGGLMFFSVLGGTIMTKNPSDIAGIIENQREKFQGNIGYSLFDSLFNRSSLLPDQKLYSIGTPVEGLPPIGIFLTDEMGLIGGILACLIVGLEFVGIPFSGYLRHNFFSVVSSLIDGVANQLGLTLVKPPTAGETEVWSEEAQKMEIPNGKSGNAFLRTFAGVYAALRDDAGILWVRAMVMMPYGRREDLFRITNGIMTSVMESDTVRLAYATRLWLQKLTAEPQAIGAVVYKGSQNDEDAFASALFTEVCERLGIAVRKPFASDFRKQVRQTDTGVTTLGIDVNELLAKLPEDFWAGISIPETTVIECYLNDMGLVKQEQWMNQRKRVIALGCDHLVDYSTDMTSFAMTNRVQFLQEAMDLSEDEATAIMQAKGYPMGGGVGSGGSTLNCMNGKTLEETTAGTALDKWKEYLAGQDPAYNLTGMVKMVVAAARNLSDAEWLQSYLDHVLAVVAGVYAEQPKARMFEAFHIIMGRIRRPWLA